MIKFAQINQFAKLFSLMISKFAGLLEVLEKLNPSEEVKKFIMDLPDEQRQYYIAYLRKNPQTTVGDMRAQVKLPEESKDPYLDFEKKTLSDSEVRFPTRFHRWALIQFRKLRKGQNLPKGLEFSLMAGNQPAELNDITLWLVNNKLNESLAPYIFFYNKLEEIRDWLIYEDDVDVNSFSAEEAIKRSDEWHQEMANEGEGKRYQEGDSNLVYRLDNGWTIKKITTANDLMVEGNKMDHCVSGYDEAVRKGNCTIYSLRDPSNEPHVTMETDGNTYYFKQIMGKKNSEPKPEYKKMISEWFKSLKKNHHVTYQVNDGDINLHDIDTASDLKRIAEYISQTQEANDYGLVPSYQNFSFNTAYENILRRLELHSYHNRYSIRNENLNAIAGALAVIMTGHDIWWVNHLNTTIGHPIPKAPEKIAKFFDNESSILEFEQIQSEHQEKLFDSFLDNVDTNRDDYETDEEFEKARDEQQEYYYEEAMQYLPHSLDKAIYDNLKEIYELPNYEWLQHCNSYIRNFK